jgi:hypothetical protein
MRSTRFLVPLLAVSLMACADSGLPDDRPGLGEWPDERAGQTGGRADNPRDEAPPAPEGGTGPVDPERPDEPSDPPPEEPERAPGERSEDGALALDVYQPEIGEVIKAATVRVKGDTEGLETVEVNGEVVEVSGDSFKVDLALPEGRQTITVVGEGLDPVYIEVFVDHTAPVVELDSPKRGAFLVAGEQDEIVVEGRVLDVGTGIAELLVGGYTVPLRADGSFQRRLVPELGVNNIDIVATDHAGRSIRTQRGVLYGEFSDWDAPTEHAVTARMGDRSFEVIERALIRLIDDGMVDQLLDQYAVGTEDIEIHDVSYSTVDIRLVPERGRLRAEILIYDLRVDLSVTYGLTLRGYAEASPARIVGYIEPELTRGGQITADLYQPQISLDGFAIHVDGIWDWVVSWVNGWAQDYAEDMLTGLAEDVIVPELFDPAMLDRSFMIMGREIAYSVRLDDLDVDTRGIAAVGNVTLPMRPSGNAPDSPGIYTTYSAPPSDDVRRMFRASISDDMINRMLATAWRSGMLDLNIRELIGDGGALPIELNAGSLALLAGQEILEHAESDTPVDVQLRPLLPPVAEVRVGRNSLLRLHLSELMMDLYLAPDSGRRVLFASVATYATLDISVTVEDDRVSLGFVLAVDVDLADEPLFDIQDALVEQVVGGLLERLPEILGYEGLDGLFDFGGLEILGVGMQNAEIHPDGPSADFLTFDVDIVNR